MGKVRFDLEREPAFDEARFEELSFGKAHWWLKEDRGDFVRLPKKVRGCDALKLTLHLEPGSYLLGVGTPDDMRENFEVEDVEVEVATAGGSDVSGKCFVLTGDLDCMDRDSAKKLLEGLSARVTGSVSGKTDFLVAGEGAGPSKMAKAKEKGIQQLDEKEFKELIGFQSSKTIAKEFDLPTSVGKVLNAVCSSMNEKGIIAAKKFGVEDSFDPLGTAGSILWAVAHGPRGGQYHIHINLNKRSNGLQCSCGRYQCQHAVGLLIFASEHPDKVPKAKVPEGHREEASARYGGVWE